MTIIRASEQRAIIVFARIQICRQLNCQQSSVPLLLQLVQLQIVKSQKTNVVTDNQVSLVTTHADC